MMQKTRQEQAPQPNRSNLALGNTGPHQFQAAPTANQRPPLAALNSNSARVGLSSAQRKAASAVTTDERAVTRSSGGLPASLKTGIEALSGMSMDHVKVHTNSSEPARINAHAYTQGSEIYLAPGQEKHLPHEAWHVVQQAQGRVKPTLQMKSGVQINNDIHLETEADAMGEKIANFGRTIEPRIFTDSQPSVGLASSVAQRREVKNPEEGHTEVFHSEPEDKIQYGIMTVTLEESRALGDFLEKDGSNVRTVTAKVEYHPAEDDPEAEARPDAEIQLIQIVRASNNDTGEVESWRNKPEARRDEIMTSGEPGTDPGWFVDHNAQHWKPRERKGQASIPHAYTDASGGIPRGETKWKSNNTQDPGRNQHGSKKGSVCVPARLWDQPTSAKPFHFQAEVVVEGIEGGHKKVYGVANWYFRTANVTKNGKSEESKSLGKLQVIELGATFKSKPSENFRVAIEKFDEVYRNPDAKTSPELSGRQDIPALGKNEVDEDFDEKDDEDFEERELNEIHEEQKKNIKNKAVPSS